MGFLLSLLQVAVQAGPAPVAPSEQFHKLTDTHSEVVNLMVEPVRPMAIASDLTVWSINPYANTLLRYDLATLVAAGSVPHAAPADMTIPTGLNPVSVALWSPLEGEKQVFVVCKGTHAVFVHAVSDGRLLDVIRLESESPLGPSFPPLMSEGADIVIDEENSWAFVSLPTANTVIKIDIAIQGSYAIIDTYQLPVGERPGPLLFEPGDPGPDDNKVLVAMTITGNDSAFAGLGISTGPVVDVSDTFGINMPDDDVYLIDPITNAVTSVATEVGSLIFELKRNPVTGGFMALSSDSNNSDPVLNTEPLLRGRFQTNQLALFDVNLTAPTKTQVSLFTDLDNVSSGPGTSYHVSTSINQARSMAVGGTGDSFVVSPFSDNVIVALSSGKRLPQTFATLPSGSQCYDIELIGPNENALIAYCLGTMTIEIILRTGVRSWGAVDLGLDPTPNQIRRGRNVFLNGRHSADGRFSCASCHPGGMSDQLSWMIEDDPLDHKDAMLTQSLLSIADTFPHHWRGERDLKDFQGAFQGLLGATPLEAPTDAEMDDFIAFVQSLQAPPNCMENPRRILDDSRRSQLDDILEVNKASVLGASSAVQGQDNFLNVVNFAERTCADCHETPTGSDGNMTFEVASQLARSTNLEVAHLRQLRHRSLKTFDLLQGTQLPGFLDLRVNVNGFGPTHNGGGTTFVAGSGQQTGTGTIFDFVTKTNVFLGPFNNQFGVGQGEIELTSVWRYVDQYDEGISPATAWSLFVHPNTTDAEYDEAKEILIDGFDQASGPWNEVVITGEAKIAGMWRSFRAHLTDTGTSSSTFVPDDPTFPQFRWGQFRIGAEAGIVRAVVMGMPLGNSERFAIDFDRDGLINSQDAAPWQPDSDSDGFPDGYAGAADITPPALAEPIVLDFRTARLAKYHVKFDEDVMFRVEYAAPGGPLLTYASVRGTTPSGLQDYADEWTFVLTHDHPSGDEPSGKLTFTGALFATDRAGNPEVQFQLPSFTPLEGGDQNIAEFLHVESVTSVPLPGPVSIPVGFTPFAFEVEVAEDELAVPGQAGFAPGVGLMVFGVVAKENLDRQVGEPAFDQVTLGAGGLLSNMATSFKTTVPPTPNNPGDTVDYTAISDYIISPLTGGQGKTTLVFFISDSVLGAGEDIKFSVQGIMRPTPGSADPLDFLRSSLGEYQPIRREGVSIGTQERP